MQSEIVTTLLIGRTAESRVIGDQLQRTGNFSTGDCNILLQICCGFTEQFRLTVRRFNRETR